VSKCEMDRLREPQIAEYLKSGEGLVLVPVGSLEQHGAHGPLGTDAILAAEVSRRLGSERGWLVGPSVPYGVSGEHKGACGLAYIGVEAFIAFCRDICLSLGEAGFRRIVFVNGHFTNSAPLTLACFSASAQFRSETRAFAVDYWAGLPEAEMAQFLGPVVGYHANIGETSLMLAVDEAAVDLASAKEGWPVFGRLERHEEIVHRAYFSSQTGSVPVGLKNGTWGNPRSSTAELGRKLLDAMVRSLGEVIDEVLAAVAAP